MLFRNAYAQGCQDALKLAGVKQNLRALMAAQRATNPTAGVLPIQKALQRVSDPIEHLATQPARPVSPTHGPLAAVINPSIGLNDPNAVTFPYTGEAGTALAEQLRTHVGRVDVGRSSGRTSKLLPAVNRSLKGRTFDHEKAFRESASGSHTAPVNAASLPSDPNTTAWKGGKPVSIEPASDADRARWVSGYPDVAAGYAAGPGKHLRKYDTAAFPNTPWTKHVAVDTRSMPHDTAQTQATFARAHNKAWAERPAYERVVNDTDLQNPTEAYRVLPQRSATTLGPDAKPIRPTNYVVPAKITP